MVSTYSKIHGFTVSFVKKIKQKILQRAFIFGQSFIAVRSSDHFYLCIYTIWMNINYTLLHHYAHVFHISLIYVLIM